MRFDERDDVDAEFEGRLTRALKAAPAPVIADDFAMRVAMRVRKEEVRRAGPARRSGYGRLAVYLALPVLLGVMVMLARFAATPMTLGIEGLMVVEFVLVAVYLALRPGVVGE